MGFSDDQLMAREASDLRLPMQGLSDEDLLRREGLAPPRAKPEPPHVDAAGDAMHRYQEARHFKEGEETPVSRTLRAGLANRHQLAQLSLDLLRAHRLEEDLAEMNGLLRADRIARGEHDIEGGPQPPRLLGEFDAAHPRHDDVAEQHIDMLLRQDTQPSNAFFATSTRKPFKDSTSTTISRICGSSSTKSTVKASVISGQHAPAVEVPRLWAAQ
jgi:hypothetical protein